MRAAFNSLPQLRSGPLPDASDAGESAERSLLCLVRPAPRLPTRSRSGGRGGLAAATIHLVVASILFSVGAWSRSERSLVTAATDSQQLPRMVFILQPAPGGGGGGGGNRQQQPPSRARAIGDDQLTVPVVRPARRQPAGRVEEPQQQVLLAAKPMGADATMMIGLPEASPSVPFSRGPGSGEGVGGGSGSGIGSGTGPGVGPGSGGGFGGGAYRLGGVVVPPTLLKQVTPKYTANAMRERIQGVVALEVVIDREGIPAAIRVIRSLDPGLDGEAIVAARQWRFTPGRIGDTPVDVIVTILLDFNVR